MFGNSKPKKKPQKRPAAPRKAAPGAAPRPRSAAAPGQRNAIYAKKGGGKRGGGNGSGGGDGFVRRTVKSRGFWVLMLRLAIAGAIVVGLLVMYFAQTLPDIHDLNTIRKQQGITITTEDGRVVSNYGDVYGEYVPYDKLPKTLIQAVVATEDRRFFVHGGIDIWGILRAMVVNVTHGHLVQGGSTITQQVAKNVFLTPERSLKRKVQEVLLAFWLEGRFTKQEIMAIYLNRVYLGSGAFGVDAASHRYFNKPATDLNLGESALIAGLLKAPSRYAPSSSPERAEARIHQVLLNMVDAGYLNKNQVQPALDAFEHSPSREADGGNVRYYTDWILDQIPNYVGTIQDDLVVTTTFDPKLQGYAVDALQNGIATAGEKLKFSEGALVAMTPDGAVRAIVGGVDYGKTQYNRATQAKRQPGSLFKLFVYLSALEAGMTPESTVVDGPISIQVGNKLWSPGNYEKGFKGEVPLVEALRESLNTAAVRLSLYTGVGKVAEMAARLGVPDIPAYPAIALGAVEATEMDMTAAFAHVANGGHKVVPYGILQIATRDGKVLYKYEKPEDQTVLAEGTVEMMNYMLMDVTRRGTGAKAAIAGRPTAGKTGTSQDFKDAWFVGFTPQLVTGVWVGNDDNSKMAKVTGGIGAAPIWHDFMVKAMDGLPVQEIPNSPSSGAGLLPWLFGGDKAQSMDNVPQAAQPVQEAAPFGGPTPAPGAAAPAPAAAVPFGGPTPAPQPAPAQPQADKGGDVLTQDFWNKLAKAAPKINAPKVQYTYPGESR